MNIINIIAPNIKNGGGKELLEYLVDYLLLHRKNIKVNLFIDHSLEHFVDKENLKVVYFSSVIKKILLFGKKIDNAIYFGNLPPLVKSRKSLVYMHNPYLVLNLSKLYKSGFKMFIKYSLQQLYIHTFLRNVDFFVCQNQLMKNNFQKLYGNVNAKVTPFFRRCEGKDTNKKYDFCYISLAHAHKNHELLLDALDIMSRKGVYCSIALTIEKTRDDLVSKINTINSQGSLEIVNYGILPKSKVCDLYNKSEVLVFPSEKETFGLPLIEAAQVGLKILAPNIAYVYQVVEPSMVFDHLDKYDLAEKMIDMIQNADNYIAAKSLVEDQVSELVDFVTD
ncbi:MAG: glycosyltransferase [Gammaproteobacteria bacterium]|nr:glycosyltransferase [Gammaproteobacteria bacterium]